MARLARRIMLGKQRDCVACGKDMGVTKEATCSDECAERWMYTTAY
jgi:predicted nucleic acid-binding Zn ribbon protein